MGRLRGRLGSLLARTGPSAGGIRAGWKFLPPPFLISFPSPPSTCTEPIEAGCLPSPSHLPSFLSSISHPPPPSSPALSLVRLFPLLRMGGAARSLRRRLCEARDGESPSLDEAEPPRLRRCCAGCRRARLPRRLRGFWRDLRGMGEVSVGSRARTCLGGLRERSQAAPPRPVPFDQCYKPHCHWDCCTCLGFTPETF